MNSTYSQAAIGIVPLGMLIYLMTKRPSMPAHKALPLSAAFAYILVLAVLGKGFVEVHATILIGALTALTPISIIWGAIFLFRTMELTGALQTLRHWLNSISPNPVAQLMIVGWAFPFLIEGASGFGTPAALAAPILVGLGFEPLKVVLLSLVMNSVPVAFGAVGTPVWFGFGELPLTEAELLSVGIKSGLVHAIAAIFVPVLALLFVLDYQVVLRNIWFILLSIVVTVLPYSLVSFVSYEFPTLAGGGIGLVATIFLARHSVGLKVIAPSRDESPSVGLSNLFKAMFPLAAAVSILVVTRLPHLPLKGMLTSGSPRYELGLGPVGVLSISSGLVIQLNETFGTALSWSHQVLYVPSIMPFVFVSIVSLFMDGGALHQLRNLASESLRQMKSPSLALLGALIFVKLMMMGGGESIVASIGSSLAGATGGSWPFFAAYLGALGSFFSGSATISNLTFGGIQYSIAQANGFDLTSILALQSVGAAMGNMVCINNIVAVCSVLGLQNIEGVILKRTLGIMIFYGVLASVVGWCMLL